MGDIDSKYRESTKGYLDEIAKSTDPNIRLCEIYGYSEFAGTSNACVCAKMGGSEASIAMRNGLVQDGDALPKTGVLDFAEVLGSHLKQVSKTMLLPGGFSQPWRILKSGAECPGTTNRLMNATSKKLEQLGEYFEMGDPWLP